MIVLRLKENQKVYNIQDYNLEISIKTCLVILKSINFHHFSLCPESSENVPILFQGADLYFSNQNDLRNPKMGSKQSIPGATEWVFFQITFFGTKNH